MERAAKVEQEFFECIRDIIYHPVVLRMKHYDQHCETDCYEHCLTVAYYNYIICRHLGLDARAAARAGMLHDLFLYDWRQHRRKTGDRFHAMTHPWTAYRKARKYFSITPLEKEIITKHMWPVTVIPPRHLETYVICFTDKYCGSLEIAEFYSAKWSRFLLLRPAAKLIHRLTASRPQLQDEASRALRIPAEMESAI